MNTLTRFCFLGLLLVCLPGSMIVRAAETPTGIVAETKVEKENHPRIYATDESKSNFLQSVSGVAWKKQYVEKLQQNVNKYLGLWQKDPTWLVSRLQMNWKTKHSRVFLHGGNFAYSDGQAPVPTVRFSGTRDWATDYQTPSLEEIEPYFDDERGLFLKKKSSSEKEWVHPSKAGFIIEGINQKIMNLAQDAAFLYWLTGENKYAEFAAPIFNTYMDGMYYRDAPIDLDKSGQQYVSGLATFEVIHEGIVVPLTVTYDFLYNYFKANNKELTKAHAVFQKWGDQIINNGVADNNWNLFQARFLTYIALALDENSGYENGKGQQYYLDRIFNISSIRQIAIKESVLVYDQETGIWPESASYSIHVTQTLLRILTLLDHTTNTNELKNFPIIEKAALAAFQYLFPTGYTVGFGDSDHKIIPPENFELLISSYRKYNEKDKELMITDLLNQLIKKGEYVRNADDLFNLFFYVDKLDADKIEEKAKSNSDLMTPTFYAPNVSLFIQRLGEGKNEMMVSTVGSFGNHAHANGISMELFADGYVLGPDMGRGQSYWNADHREYYSQSPAHNTVVVNGNSDGQSMRGNNPFTLDNCFPKPAVTQPTFNKLTFSKVSFVEPKSMSDQQRLTAVINTNSGKGYVLDIFRSKKQVPSPQKHEYFYHNLGQSLQVFDAKEKELVWTPTNELSTKADDQKGYDYFTDKKSAVSDQNLTALFRLKSAGKSDQLMKMWIKGNKDQVVFSLNGPKSNAISKGTAPVEMLDAKIPAIVLKRNEEAWLNPFVTVFNPFISGDINPVSKVEFEKMDRYPATQTIRVLQADEKTEDVIVANTSENDISAKDGFFQKGLLSVTRWMKLDKSPAFIFLSGVYKFESNGWEINAINKAVTISVERVGSEYILQSDQPVILRLPIVDGFAPKILQLFENDKYVGKVDGRDSKNNNNKIEFRLDRACQKAIISMK